MKKTGLIISLLFISISISLAQVIEKPEYEISLNSLPHFGSNTPFWLTANQQGKYLPHGFNNTIEARIKGDINHDKKLSIGYGIEAIDRFNQSNQIYLNQAYLEAKILFGKISVGAQNTTYGNQDPTLSSGGLLWSGNARPMPKIGIGTDGFVDFPFTHGYLEFSGYMEHGWFENDRDGWMEEPRYVKNVLLHHKFYRLKAGGDLPVHIHWGLHHYALWAGNSPEVDDPLPRDLDAFYRVFIPQSADPSSSTHEGEVINKYGNHLGGRIIGLDAEMKDFYLNLYWQTIFEDGSGLNWHNSEDGLYGISLKMKDKSQVLSGVCFELLHTIEQSGPVHDPDKGLKGNDNYFNHYVYESGWSYYGFTIGNPFITSPIFNETGYKFQNNKVIVHHYGFEGNIYKDLNYKLHFTFHDNFGTNSAPYEPPKDFMSTMLTLNFPVNILNGLDISTRFAVDSGDMYGYNFGFMFSVTKRGSFFSSN
jgi:hypothetical protein